ncbi:MAG: glycerophosphodiester phosphodiesterase family protein [Oscillospiraceae bacterium]|nr:glycerophosphodiester phosphodiesterase family protein [Oscillospiraceae bacterium]
MTALIIILAAVILLLIFALRPQTPVTQQMRPFINRNFAHRGLHTEDKSVPENSLPAFEAAVKAGYGMELDIQLTKDGQVVVFHDDTLNRVCGVEGRVDAYTYEELQAFGLCKTNYTIPLFSEVLQLVDGKTPLIVELKTGPHNAELCEKGLALLQSYSGDYCIESFDPNIVRWFYKNAPDILRGQLASVPKSYGSSTSPALAFMAGNLLANFLGRPNFIAYDKVEKPLLAKLGSIGAMRVVWTIRPENDIAYYQNKNDAVIFEFYTPEPRYTTEEK